MRPARQPAQYVFGPDDRQREALGGAVQRGQDEEAARPHQRASGGQEGVGVGHVLDHLQGEDDIEKVAGFGQGFRRRGAIVDGQPAGHGVAHRRRHVVGGRVDAGDAAAEPCQRFGQQPAPRADVEDRQAIERQGPVGRHGEMAHHRVAQVADADGIEAMQRRHGALRVPPVVAERVELRDVGAVHRCGGAVDGGRRGVGHGSGFRERDRDRRARPSAAHRRGADETGPALTSRTAAAIHTRPPARGRAPARAWRAARPPDPPDQSR